MGIQRGAVAEKLPDDHSGPGGPDDHSGPGGQDMSKADKIALVAALMAVMFLGALDVTIVTIAAPHISKALGGFGSISFLFSAYTLTSSVTVPIFGKLSDLHGRKRVLLAGILVFLLGSVLCAVSQSMLMLILSRAIQGAGTGSIFTLVNTIVADVFELKVRSRIMGAVGTVWGAASLVGPFTGGLLIDHLSWHWIFLINIPVGVLALALLMACFKERFARRKARFDLGGAALLSLVILGILLGVNALTTQGGAIGAGPVAAAASFALAGIALLAFILVERRVSEPVIPKRLNTRATTVVNTVSFVTAMALIGASVYEPLFFQEVLGLSATMAGLALLPETAVWLLVSFILAPLLIRFGDRKTLLAACALMLLGFLSFLLLSPQTPVLVAALIIAGAGLGLGGVMNATLLIIQESVGIENRGAAVGLNSMLKSLGQAIGIGLMGGVFNIAMLAEFNKQGVPAVFLDNPHEAAEALAGVTEAMINADYFAGAQMVFAAFIALSAVALAVAQLMPKNKRGSD
jgi:EmrB/QacA subfamily drug resistance transporter